ncbi:hypothetical protein CHS0354_013461 [Potamilus streckersoni]|uniref:Uncharacterized protein n=1 Tax=Potamilus streckersoni TaxID=2493646 RepID=A0AAE0RYW7_9BIVA|nr:hypothetical protein CHS0354_013461 [Potamilus streckersoni]
MASRMYMRRSHEKKRPSLQPDTFVPPNKSGSPSNASSESGSNLHFPMGNEINRQSFLTGVLDRRGSEGSTLTSGGSDRSSSIRNCPDTPLIGLKNLKTMDTMTRRLINSRFRIFCFGLIAILLVVVLLSLYRLLT